MSRIEMMTKSCPSFHGLAVTDWIIHDVINYLCEEKKGANPD
jgi:hypothetical protein